MRDGHVHVLPIHVANKIAAGEVVERPASVVKELLENAIDAGAKHVQVAITQGGRKLVSVRDDGCGMTKDDAVLALERQATSKILDVDDIERIDTLGFRGEAIPSIASVSRFSLTTRRADTDEGTTLSVNAGVLAEVRAAGCPVGTLVEVRDLFCNVPARQKFLRSYTTEETHVKSVFTTHALAHPEIGFALTVDGRELYRLAPAANLADRVRDLFGDEFVETLLPLSSQPQPSIPQPQPSTPQPQPSTPQPQPSPSTSITGFIERPNRATPSRRDQYVFVNGRPATAPTIAYALREGYPRQPGDVRPAVILFITVPPTMVDVNVHPTKREVRFRDNTAVKNAILTALDGALRAASSPIPTAPSPAPTVVLVPHEHASPGEPRPTESPSAAGVVQARLTGAMGTIASTGPHSPAPHVDAMVPIAPTPPAPIAIDLPLAPDSPSSRPWRWFHYLASTESGYLLIETDAGIVTINPRAARERIAFETLLRRRGVPAASQSLLLPETARLSPPDFARVSASLETIRSLGFAIEPFGTDTFKIDAVPQLIGGLSPAALLATIARDLAVGAGRNAKEKWREELIAKSIARSYAGMDLALNEEGATKLVEELAAARMPYVCPRGRPILIFTSNRDLDAKFRRSAQS